jgi:hypothetical protein
MGLKICIIKETVKELNITAIKETVMELSICIIKVGSKI